MPARKGWVSRGDPVQFLTEELNRRDRRAFYLWTVTAAAAAIVWYCAQRVYWTQELQAWPLGMAGAVAGTLTFAFAGSPLAERLLRAYDPLQLHHTMDLREGLVAAFVLDRLGLHPATRVATALQLLAPLALATFLFITALERPGPLLLLFVPAITFAIGVGAAGSLVVLVPRKRLKSFVALIYVVGYVWSGRATVEAARESTTFRELEQLTNWGPTRWIWKFCQMFPVQAQKAPAGGLRVAPWATAFLLTAFLAAVVAVVPPSASRVDVALAFFLCMGVAGAGFAAHLLAALTADNTRERLERLRSLALNGETSPAGALAHYRFVEFLRSWSFYHDISTGELEGLRNRFAPGTEPRDVV